MFSATLLVLALNTCPIPTPQFVYDSPALEHDVKRFPCKWVARRSLELADRHIAWLEAWQTTDDSAELQCLLTEAKELRSCWWALYFAWVPPTRQDDMDELRKLLGPENYRLARMPPPMPRFARGD